MLRDYQFDIYMKVVNEIQRGKRGILVNLPCRSGKSYIMSEMINNLVNGYGLVLAHRKELIKQHKELLESLNIKNYRVASVFTEVNHLGEYEKPSVIFIDECHLSEAITYKKVCHYYNCIIVGFSATPTRLNGDRLSLFDCIVTGISAKELQNKGAISEYDYYAPDIGISTDGVSVLRGDYSNQELQDLFSKSVIYGDVIKYYKVLANNKQAIAYCVSILESKKLVNEFEKSGISAKHLDSKTPKKIRDELMSEFKQGKFKILCNVGLISEGITVPNCDVCLLIRPTQSLALYIQQAMRCLTPNGRKSIIIDFVGNFQRHNLPTANREWTLDGVVKKHSSVNSDGSFSIRQCPKCFKVFKTANKCPYCGYDYEIKGKELKQMQDVELKKIEALEEERLEHHKKEMRKEVGRAKTKEELIKIARDRNYDIGWVYVQMKLKGIR